MSHGLQVNASYTYSHTLDEGSGLGAGLFFNGNNPLNPRTSYASSDFDRPHVFTISYLYDLPTMKRASGLLDAAVNGWGITGVTVLQSGEPYSIVDFSGTAGGVYYSADDFVTNPLLPLAPGITPAQAKTPGGGVNPNDFSVPYLLPTDGSNGVPPCQTHQRLSGLRQLRNRFRHDRPQRFPRPVRDPFRFLRLQEFQSRASVSN